MARNTVKCHVTAGRYVPCRLPSREGKLDGLFVGKNLTAHVVKHNGAFEMITNGSVLYFSRTKAHQEAIYIASASALEFQR